MLQRALASNVVRSFAPALTVGVHTSTAVQAPAAAMSRADTSQAVATLQGLLGLSGAEVQLVLAEAPAIALERPSVLQERVQFLYCGLGLSPSRLRSLVLQKPALLSDLSLRELRGLVGLE